MAVKCPICGAENPEGKVFCGDCGARIPERAPNESVSPVPQQLDAFKARWYSLASPSTTRKLIVVAIILIVVAGALAYYYQPVRGTGWASLTTVVNGGTVQFSYSPSQGISPYRYSWSFGDGSISTEKSPTHIYSTVGTYRATVTVTDQAGMKGRWTTTINVRLPLVFIDTISYPSALAALIGDTQLKLFVDGAQVGTGAALQAGTSHTIRLQILWVMDFGFAKNTQIMSDDKGSITAPATQTDLHCVLHYDPYGDPMFTLSAG